jgi:hypothetical protein
VTSSFASIDEMCHQVPDVLGREGLFVSASILATTMAIPLQSQIAR